MASTSSDALYAGPIPEIYERYLVPMIFEPYAKDLARRAAALGARRVLETAAGTGAVTRALASSLPPDATLTATDLNPSMIERAQATGMQRTVSWQAADAQALPFADGEFDLAVCQFGAMFFPDKVRAFAQARRVLRPGGWFIFSVWDRIEENDFAESVTQTLATLMPDDPPRFLARTPHGHADAAALRRDLAAAGFSVVAVETLSARSHAPSASEPAIGFCQGTPLRNEIEAHACPGLDAATQACATAIAERFGDGPVSGKIQAIVVSAQA